jgi:hypothetical protein
MEETPSPPEPESPPSTGTRPETKARGPLRPGPAADAPQVEWRPDPEAVPGPEVGTLEQRVARRRDPDVRTVLGSPTLQAIGWSVFILGGLIYLRALWATANAAIAGAPAEQIVRIGGLEFLQGTLGLTLLVIGGLTGLLFTFVPVHREPRLVPGTLEFEVAGERLRTARNVRRILMWSGLGVFLIGFILAAWPLQQTVADGSLYRLSLGGTGYRIHFWGYMVAAAGIALVLPMALTLGTMERVAAVTEGALSVGRVRRARRDPPLVGAHTTDAEREADASEREGVHGSETPRMGAGRSGPLGPIRSPETDEGDASDEPPAWR